MPSHRSTVHSLSPSLHSLALSSSPPRSRPLARLSFPLRHWPLISSQTLASPLPTTAPPSFSPTACWSKDWSFRHRQRASGRRTHWIRVRRRGQRTGGIRGQLHGGQHHVAGAHPGTSVGVKSSSSSWTRIWTSSWWGAGAESGCCHELDFPDHDDAAASVSFSYWCWRRWCLVCDDAVVTYEFLDHENDDELQQDEYSSSACTSINFSS